MILAIGDFVLEFDNTVLDLGSNTVKQVINGLYRDMT